MNCREFVEFLMTYLDGELEEAQRSLFEEHLRDCPGCIDYLDSYRKTVELGGSLCQEPEGPVPDEVPEDLVAAVLAARSGRR
jgi:anti-sigma factor RsiW